MTKQLSKFEFKGHGLRILPSDDGTSFWVVAKDVTDILGYPRANDAVRAVPEHHKGTRSARTLGGMQKMVCVDEPGLYWLVLRSNKPEAAPFIEWVISQVLPSIRRTGAYVAPRAAQAQVQNRLIKMEADVTRSHLEDVIDHRNRLLSEKAALSDRASQLESKLLSLFDENRDLLHFKVSVISGEAWRNKQLAPPLGGAS